METYADMASDLLSEAANFFTKLAETNEGMKQQMAQNVATFMQMADLIKSSPEGRVENMTHGEMAARLLKEAALFFRSIGEQNPPLAEQMEENADIYDSVAAIVEKQPTLQLQD